MKLWRRRELRDSIRPERVKSVMEFGFTESQARFVLHVLVYSGVFVERQYRAFTGVSHGQRTKDFLSNIIGRGTRPRLRPGSCTKAACSTSGTSRSTKRSEKRTTATGSRPRTLGSSNG